MKIGFVVLAVLFTCSLLGGAVTLIPFDDLLGDDDAQNAQNQPDPNRDLIAEQKATVAANPDDMQAVLLLANMLGNAGKLDEAIDYYERAADMAPDDVALRLDFARALANGGLDADAELQFQKALGLEPDNQDALYYLAQLYMNQDPPRTKEAIDLYQRAIVADPDTYLATQAQNQLDSIPGAPSSGATPNATPQHSPGDGTNG